MTQEMTEDVDRSLEVNPDIDFPKKEPLPRPIGPKIPLIKRLIVTLTMLGGMVTGTGCTTGGAKTPENPSSTPTEGLGGTSTETYTPPKETPTKTVTPTETQIPTPEIDYAKIDIFNESTWPEKYQDFWETGWLHSKDPERLDFQNFMEGARKTFFEKMGITDRVAEMTNIRPELRSLWGMALYVNLNKEEVAENQTFIPVTPTELEWIMTDPALGPGLVHSEKQIISSDNKTTTLHYSYMAYTGNITSDLVGSIAGKDELVSLPRKQIRSTPYENIEGGVRGDLLGLGVVGGGESTSNIFLIDVVDEKGFNHLSAPSFSFGEITLPKGTVCLADAATIPETLTLDANMEIKPIYNQVREPYAKGDLFNLIGKNLNVESTWRDYPALFSYSPVRDYTCPHPITKDDLFNYLASTSIVEGELEFWPLIGR